MKKLKNKNDININVVLSDSIKLQTFSTIVAKIIKHIAYNTQQIPYAYETLAKVIKLRQGLDTSESSSSSSDLLAMRNYYKKMLTVYHNYEAIFENLTDCLSSPCVEQVLMILGSSLAVPKQMYVIHVPSVEVNQVKESTSSILKHLSAVYRNLVYSQELNRLFDLKLEPTNVYIVVKTIQGHSPKSSHFVPCEVKPTINIPVSNIRFEIDVPVEFNESNEGSSRSFSVHEDEQDSLSCLQDKLDQVTLDNVSRSPFKDKCHCNLSKPETSNYFQAKQPIKGFKDVKTSGGSLLSCLLKVRC